ncbi:MAG TPA: glycosyltransferase [Pyrinomonadaceae bacterium]|jgi:hypothetical protein|nr:glycosyltransferase [Pyrinomonadaceae bacterium]
MKTERRAGGGARGRHAPEMTVVIVTPDRFETVRKTIRHLRAQHVRERLELVIVAPAADALALDERAVRDFFGYRVIQVGAMTSTARARAAGVRGASAPVVALVEDHCFPAPGWAEALIERHAGGWAAVGPVMANANPQSAVSWANLLTEYAPWIEPAPGGEREHLPGHNGSYKRDVLLAYGDRLEAMLEAESVLHWDLRARGHKLYLEPRARSFHLNFTAALPSAVLRFNGGRLFAASRARGWPLRKRLAFVAGAPLIPLVRFARVARGVPRAVTPRGTLATVFAALVCDGAGEMAGYAFGAGAAMEKLSDMEFHRHRYISRRDHGAATADAAEPVEGVREAGGRVTA